MKIGASRSVVAGAAAIAGGVTLCGIALVRAVAVGLPEAGPAGTGFASAPEVPPASASPARAPSDGALEPGALALAVDHDPFMPERRRAAPYRLPGERERRPVTVRVEERVDPPPFRVIGTAMQGESGIAVVEMLETGTPEVVRVGGSVLGYRLEGVDPESATLVMRQETFTLGVQSGSEGRAARGRGSNTREEMERYRTAVERLRESGLPPELVERLLGSGQTWSPDGRRIQFSTRQSFQTFETRSFEVPIGRMPSGRAGRAGRAGRDTLSWEPR